MRFEFATASRILFGPGVLDAVPAAVRAKGRRAFIITGRSHTRAKGLIDSLRASGIDVDIFAILAEPTTDDILEAVSRARAHRADVVIGMGGGSPIDAGKAVAALLTNEGVLTDYLEVIGLGKPINCPPLPFIAIPTTAGTGAEVTRNAVIGSPAHHLKVSMRSPLMLPALAVVDPLLTLSMSKATTAATGLDALTQLIEPFVSHLSNPLTDTLCREGLARVSRSLVRACEEGDDLPAREDMSLASLFGGLALANAKLGAVHGFAGVIGGMFYAPHGAICAKLLAPVMTANVRALTDRDPGNPALSRFDDIAVILTGRVTARAMDGVRFVAELGEALEISPLSELGINRGDFPSIVDKATHASSMKGNPVILTEDELSHILEQALVS